MHIYSLLLDVHLFLIHIHYFLYSACPENCAECEFDELDGTLCLECDDKYALNEDNGQCLRMYTHYVFEGRMAVRSFSESNVDFHFIITFLIDF